MKFKIQKEEKNPLLHRLDLEVIIDHEGGATPSREDIRKKLSAEKGWDLAQIEVKFVHSIYGSPFSKGIIKVWDEAQEKLKPAGEEKSQEPKEKKSEDAPAKETSEGTSIGEKEEKKVEELKEEKSVEETKEKEDEI